MSIYAHPGETRVTPRPPTIHELKTWIEYFEAVRSGAKRFEVRRADRDFQVNDMVLQREWDHEKEFYTGRWGLHVITYLVQGVFAIPDVAIFGISDPLRIESDEPHSQLGPYADRIGANG